MKTNEDDGSMKKSEVIKIVNEVTEKIKPSSFSDYREYILAFYNEAKKINKSFTYRVYSDWLGFGDNYVAIDIVKGRRSISKQKANGVAKKLRLLGDELKYFKTLIEYCDSTKNNEAGELLEKLVDVKSRIEPSRPDEKLLEYLSVWYHPVILELIKLKQFKIDAKEIIKNINFNLRPRQVEDAINKLVQLGYLKVDKDGFLHATEESISTGHRVSGLTLNKIHQEMIEKALEALPQVKGKERNFTTMTISLSDEKLKQIKGILQDANQKIFELSEEGDQGVDSKRVFQLNIQLFPFTKK